MADGVVINRLAARELEAAGAILARSHRDDPAFAHVVRGTERARVGVLGRVFAEWCADALPFAAVHSARSSGRLVGVAAWMPPGTFPVDPVRFLRGTARALPLLLRAPGPSLRVLRYMRPAETAHPAGDKWYLEILGVDDGARGMGVGSALLDHGLGIADAARLPCFLETSRRENVRWYERFGFRTEHAALRLVSGAGAPTHCTMWRRPTSG